MTAPVRRIADLSIDELAGRLACGQLYLDYGAALLAVRSSLRGFAADLQRVYGAFALLDRPDFLDLHVRMERGRGLRRWLRPQARFLVDGGEPFEPFPLDNALPLFEWGVNWCFARRCNQHLLLHAGVLALGGRAVIMAAPPGSGKSTLTAAMMLDGFRLLSDEFGVLTLARRELLPMLKPVALKNASMDVIADFSPQAGLGRRFAGTRKGDVGHLGPDAASVAALAEPARPALLIFPAWQAGAGLACERLAPEQAFAQLAFNSFNYAQLGEPGFHAVADVTERCPAWTLGYSDLREAIGAIRGLLAETGSSRGQDADQSADQGVDQGLGRQARLERVQGVEQTQQGGDS